jgi:hypothetical protein
MVFGFITMGVLLIITGHKGVLPNMNDIWKNLIIAVISFLLAFIGQYYYYQDQLEIKQLDVHKHFDPNFIAKPKFPDSKIEFKIDGNEKDEVGKLNISIVNYSTKAFEDLPIKIKITPEDTNNFKVLTYSAVGEKEVSGLIKEDQKMTFDGNSYTFSYTVSTVNREEQNNYSLQLRILFEGNEEPNVDVVAKGVGTRDYDETNSPHQKSISWKAAWLAIGLFILVLSGIFIVTWLIIGPIISLATQNMELNRCKKYATQLIEAIRAENLHPELDDVQLSNHVAKMLYARQLIWWNNQSGLRKWSFGFVAPKSDDYYVAP